jgi:hypothetical protein
LPVRIAKPGFKDLRFLMGANALNRNRQRALNTQIGFLIFK